MAINEKRTITCRCGKRVTIDPTGSGVIKHGCGRLITHANGLVSNLQDKPKSKKSKKSK